MLDKKGYEEGEAVLRFKGNINDSNPAFRDFPLARINLAEHPIQKNKYRVWPLMNLSVAVDDIEFKTTHAVRGKDHRDNAERQKLIFKVTAKKLVDPQNVSFSEAKANGKILTLMTCWPAGTTLKRLIVTAELQ